MATSEFDLLREEFAAELVAMKQMLQLTREAAQAGDVRLAVRSSASHATYLLLAASFEEFIRQSVKAYTRKLLVKSAMGEPLPSKMRVFIWDRCVTILRGQKLDKENFDASVAKVSLKHMIDFCLGGDQGVIVEDVLAFNERNVGPEELNLICKRVGLEDVCKLIGATQAIQDFFGISEIGKVRAEVFAIMKDFYSDRNNIAHSIGSVSLVTGVSIDRYIEFFENLNFALCQIFRDF